MLILMRSLTCCAGLVLLSLLKSPDVRGTEGSAVLQPSDDQREVRFGEPFSIAVGKSVIVRDSGQITITFEAVREDSRCPNGTTCVWAGDAAVELIATDTEGSPYRIILHTHATLEREVEFDGHLLRLLNVEPYPRDGSTIEPDQYIALLEVQTR